MFSAKYCQYENTSFYPVSQSFVRELHSELKPGSYQYTARPNFAGRTNGYAIIISVVLSLVVIVFSVLLLFFKRRLSIMEETVGKEMDKRKAAEESLNKSEMRLLDILSNTDLFSIMLDRNGRITFLNDYTLKKTGWNKQEVIGKNWFDFFVPDRSVVKMFSKAFMSDNIPASFENLIEAKWGETFLVKWNNTILRDDMGNLTGVISIGHDITEIKRMEKALQESEDRFKAVFESTTDSIFVWSRNYICLYANQAAISHFNTKREKLIGRNIRDGLENIPEFVYRWRNWIDEVLTTDQSKRVEDSAFVDNNVVFSESTFSPIVNSDGGEEFCVILPETESGRAIAVAERIRQSFRDETFTPSCGDRINVTVSVGAAQLRNSETLKDFIRRADDYMYTAKKGGKDKIFAE